ncbi:hypothetical protein ILFOPFJJ_01869 [Ensifer psoraleae]|nr:hypothetical protein [Sinorhizobium psoraleae]
MISEMARSVRWIFDRWTELGRYYSLNFGNTKTAFAPTGAAPSGGGISAAPGPH